VLIGLHAAPRLSSNESIAAETAKALRIVRATKALGGSLLIASSSGVPRDASGVINRAVLDVYTKNLDRFGGQCREEGIRLAVHNHAKELANAGEELHAVMAACDARNVGALMDVSFFVEAGLPPHDFIRKYAPRVAGIHLRDMKDGKEVEVSQGNLNLPALADALRDSLRAGWVILEMNKREDQTSKEMITRNRARMKQHLGV
ncbi:MAG: sugar phosphate isomerase/epimerase, partial [Acidobacteria bacterium]|nr:sugar phosphate isomerase/epimerase [Acidobacteriota bacterium]